MIDRPGRHHHPVPGPRPTAILLKPRNVTNLLVQNGYILILAIGMVMVIIAGHIDLSVGSVCAFVGAPWRHA